jgi:hypothetical protein
LLQNSSKTCFSSWFIFCDPAWAFEFILYFINYVISGVFIFSEFLNFCPSPRGHVLFVECFSCLSLVSPDRTVYISLP